MGTEGALGTVRAYHGAWTGGDFERAASYLAPDLEIEVPINDYPDAGSFAAAVKTFGSLASDVRLIAALGDRTEAMLLYDMQVEGLGPLRVAEHFTVEDERIVRLRQIHDTAAIRAASLAEEAS